MGLQNALAAHAGAFGKVVGSMRPNTKLGDSSIIPARQVDGTGLVGLPA